MIIKTFYNEQSDRVHIEYGGRRLEMTSEDAWALVDTLDALLVGPSLRDRKDD